MSDARIRVHDRGHESTQGVVVAFIEDDPANPMLERVMSVELSLEEATALLDAITSIIARQLGAVTVVGEA